MENRDWDNMSNGKIREELLHIHHEQEVLKNKVSELLNKIEHLHKEYFIGNKTIVKRLKGVE